MDIRIPERHVVTSVWTLNMMAWYQPVFVGNDNGKSQVGRVGDATSQNPSHQGMGAGGTEEAAAKPVRVAQPHAYTSVFEDCFTLSGPRCVLQPRPRPC